MNFSTPLLEELLYAGHINEGCPYLGGRKSRMLFLYGRELGHLYASLLDAGYRRHGVYIYRTDCEACNECRVMRVPVNQFGMSRSQKRVWKRGQKVFQTRLAAPGYSPEKARLYQAYLKSQHQSDSRLLTEQEYEELFVESFLGPNTYELQLYADKRLVGVGILDCVVPILSSVYFYFHPEYASFSPGTYSMLEELRLAREWQLDYYYPGYYISGCTAMSYKKNFRPCQVQTPQGDWVAAGG